MTIANARPIADRFSLDVEGFAVVRHRSAVRDFWGEARTLALGHPEAADLLPSELIFPHRRGETYALAYNPARRWCYVPDLDIDETLLIKCWDADEAVARFAPHAGFDDPITPPGTRRARASSSAPSLSSTEGVPQSGSSGRPLD